MRPLPERPLVRKPATLLPSIIFLNYPDHFGRLIRPRREGIPSAMNLKGRTGVVTGGVRGIGAAAARALRDAGATVLVTARRPGSAEELALDVSDPKSVDAFAREARRRLGHVDILVNNAGIASSAPIKRIAFEDWNHIIAVNLTGTMLCTQAFIAEMAERGWGRVVNMASIAARTGAPYVAAYTASKHGVLGFTRVAASEYASKGVTVNAVCPGYVDTDMTTESVKRVMEKTGLPETEALQAILRTANQPRLISPEEVAFAVVSLCANEASGLNGQALIVDAGGLLS